MPFENIEKLYISKTIIARSFKLGQLIEMTSRVPGGNLRKSYYIVFLVIALCIFMGYYPLQIKFCNQDISNSITARSFKLCQQIEDNN